jgi:hypothetical protein
MCVCIRCRDCIVARPGLPITSFTASQVLSAVMPEGPLLSVCHTISLLRLLPRLSGRFANSWSSQGHSYIVILSLDSVSFCLTKVKQGRNMFVILLLPPWCTQVNNMYHRRGF